MRTVDAHLLGDKMDEAVTHYINSHQSDEAVHVDVNALALNVQEDASRLNMLQTQNFTPHLCRQVPVTEHETEGQWTEELLDPDGRLAALMAHFVAQPRAPPPSNHKDSVRGDVDTVILDSSMRLFNGPPLDQSSGSLVVEVPPLPLPPLQGIKRCQETDWFHDKTKGPLKTDDAIVTESDGVLEIAHSKQQNKKSLPHKKRISRKLKKGNGDTTPQHDIVVLSCAAEQQEEILPDSFAAGTLQQTHHMTHQVRSMFICQLCGEYYGEEQLKFYHHLRQHYEPHGTIIIENPVPDLPIDKMTNSCIVDNGATLPDSIVELSLENTVPKTIYQSMDKHMLYTTHDKTLSYSSNKVLYSMASMEKEPEQVVSSEEEKTDLYETLDKLEFYSCGRCNKTFRKQKECEEHIKEAHSHPKLEEMGEFSEPEDLMEGIHVSVEDAAEQYEQSLLPHLTVDSGHVTQEHARHWYVRGASNGTAAPCGPSSLCPLCPHGDAVPESQPLKVLKEEVLQRILESDVTSEAATFSENMITESTDPPAAPSRPPTPPPPPVPPPLPPSDPKKKPPKKFECVQCGKCFKHRNSLLYHTMSHNGKQHTCRECGKGFYTTSALKIHKRVHSGDKPHKCDACGRDFRQGSDLTYHKISKHSDVKMFKCEYCGKEFARKYSLNVHRRIHTGERNYKCEYCTKSFSASSYRLSHMRTHTGDRPYKCSQCEKCFRVAGDLRRHTLIHDKARATASRLDPSRQKPKPKDPDEEKHKDADSKVTQKTITKKIAVASTTKGPNFKSPDKKSHKPKKGQDAKKGAPNVTIDQMDSSYTNNVEVFDTRQGYVFVKELDQDLDGEERDMTILRSALTGTCDTEKPTLRPENTDGKMQIYTHIKKNKLNKEFTCMVTTPAELRDQPDTTETGFIERLTALYNISAV